MQMKSFTDVSMGKALRKVRAGMGPGAVIINTRSYIQGGFMGWGGRHVVEVTATDDWHIVQARRCYMTDYQPAGWIPTVNPAPNRALNQALNRAPQYDWDRQETAGDLIRRIFSIAGANGHQSKGSNWARNKTEGPTSVQVARSESKWDVIDSPEFDSDFNSDSASGLVPDLVPDLGRGHSLVSSPDSYPESTLLAEVALAKQMVAKVLGRQQDGMRATAQGPQLCPDLFEQYQELIKSEVAEDLAEQIVRRVSKSVAGQKACPVSGPVSDKLSGKVSGEQLLVQLQDEIASMLPVDEMAGQWTPTSDGRPRIMALIGPTGVGKTTTIAKLAAHFKLKHHRKVGLITLDTFRIAAVDQLKNYADILGAPMHVVTRQAEMEQALAQCGECDLVLIDTVGRSPKDDDRLEELAQLLRVADPHEVHLVLSSTCSQSAMLHAVEKFSRIRTDRIIFTKLDEAATLGVILNVMAKVEAKLSFLTTGQEVPYHIEASEPTRLAARLLGRLEQS